MGYKVVEKRKIADNTFLMRINAPDVAKNAKAGQFVMLRLHANGERIPLTIAAKTKKEVSVVFLACGNTTTELSNFKKGDELLDFTGPLGNPTGAKKYGNVCLVGGGLGIAPLYLIADTLKKEGNSVSVVIGAKSKKYLFWEKELDSVCDNLVVCTDDGSRGEKGFVTNAVDKLLKKKHHNLVYTVGPPVMMKAVSDVTKQRAKTIASINSIMVDGIGMCGSCRVTVGDELKFACVDGPDFDAHDVDWDELLNRNNAYEEEECGCNEKKDSHKRSRT